MSKKPAVIFFIFLILLLIAGGAFWWWQSGEELRELNKDLPRAVRIIKDSSGQYKITNQEAGFEVQIKEDLYKTGYEEYIRGEDDPIIKGSTIALNHILISYFEFAPGTNLESWLQKTSQENRVIQKIQKQKIGEIEVLKTCIAAINGKDTPELCDNEDDYDYFFEIDSKNYKIMYASEKEVEEIIKNGNWDL